MKKMEMTTKNQNLIKKMMAILNKKLVFSLMLGLIILLSSCTEMKDKALIENDFKKIEAGMTSTEVKKILGKPDKELRSFNEIEEAFSVDDETTTDRWYYEEVPDLYERFYGSEEEADRMFDYLSEHRNKIDMCYEYNYSFEKDESERYFGWHIYFIDDEVVTMYFP
ncbi:hypothetical protein [Enterococcus sp. BWR-S5]|uniref:hypothetical protein n=1 Tax=Enterococcus sp. BWR-S5 TaxID=2787714 RepID=UPI0019221843|nr:hypothetical protein [Enterococcus sp. BWR-S5]MBL1224138.1 hypothetical protein [Enterococcus sp. BWR-S5]